MTAEGHVGELRLRRFRTGELPAAESAEVARHAAGCPPCRARLRSFDDEQRQFEREIPFERFAGGVDRARRVPRPSRPRGVIAGAAAALAAAAALVLVARSGELAPRSERAGATTAARREARARVSGPPVGGPSEAGGVTPGTGPNRLKGAGGSDATLRVGGPGSAEQRAWPSGTRPSLVAGERVRLGVRADSPRNLVAVSIDEAGVVTTLYPEGGSTAMPVPAGRELTYLPDSLELTGPGRERVFLVLAERALTVDAVNEAARAGFANSHGDLDAFSTLPLQMQGQARIDQFTWLVKKP